MTNHRKACLEQVEDTVLSDRNRDYGDPEDNFADTAKILNVLLRNKLHPDHELHPHDVALIMTAVKLARAKTSPHKLDHYIDIAGYACCGYACVVATAPEVEAKPKSRQTIQCCPKCLSSRTFVDERQLNQSECMDCGHKFKRVL